MSHRSYFHLYARVGHYRSEVTAERNELLIAKNHPTSSIDFISIGNFSTAREGLNTLNRFFWCLLPSRQWTSSSIHLMIIRRLDSTRLDSTRLDSLEPRMALDDHDDTGTACTLIFGRYPSMAPEPY